MKYIQLGIHLTDGLGIQSVVIDHNDTGLENNSRLLELVAFTILKGIKANSESVQLQDVLGELDIKTTK